MLLWLLKTELITWVPPPPQFILGQPHPMRGLWEEQEVQSDRGGQQASSGGQGGPEETGPERHPLHLCSHLSPLLHPTWGELTNYRAPLQHQGLNLWIFLFIFKSLKCRKHIIACRKPWVLFLTYFFTPLSPFFYISISLSLLRYLKCSWVPTHCWPMATWCRVWGHLRWRWWPRPSMCLCWCAARPTSSARGSRLTHLCPTS